MINVGILGTGFGSEHARIYKQIHNVTLKKVFGRTKEKLDKIEATFHVATTKGERVFLPCACWSKPERNT